MATPKLKSEVQAAKPAPKPRQRKPKPSAEAVYVPGNPPIHIPEEAEYVAADK